MLLLTGGIAFVAAAFLLIEWQSLRERFLLSFAAGFLSITVGCSLAPLRETGSFVLGIWLSNSMLPLAHLCFLHATASFSGRRLARSWCLVPLGCSILMALPGMGDQALSLFNAAAVALLSIAAARLLLGNQRKPNRSETRMLVCTFLFHGGFYALKATCAFAPGAFVDLSRYAGTMIPISLFEGVLVAVALAMSIASALRRRREDHATRLAESDALTGLLNRRGFERRADRQLARPSDGGALLLIDIDHFKTVNDCFGHQEGDRLLVALGEYLRARSPVGAIVGRLGGDEFAVMLPRLDEARALQFAQDLCAGFGQRVGPGNCGTLSIGCATFGAGPGDWSDLHLQADRGLYVAKSGGRNRAGITRLHANGPESASSFLFPLAANG
ncbi:GGDEF domain-containing protein [Novosphingobium sp. BL-52-GroH]|uniref:GGDEF domain-containing protein n=1 Tax=Novosphingobium sp. BL-52-GroH TaxID=3349877 RepID=UPI00384DB8B1